MKRYLRPSANPRDAVKVEFDFAVEYLARNTHLQTGCLGYSLVQSSQVKAVLPSHEEAKR
ncbi:unnamed protein product [marine sediment metagenome]|uniref:Uncharacterized protein n=1 Tax=marine sediment metagenome TaxID=412755 RepID=X0SN06_9ZZZZ